MPPRCFTDCKLSRLLVFASCDMSSRWHPGYSLSQPLSTYWHVAAAAAAAEANCMSTAGCLVEKKPQQCFSTCMQGPALGGHLVGMSGAQPSVGAPMMSVSWKPICGACAGPGDLAKWPSSSRCTSLQPLGILLRRIAGSAAKSSTTQVVLVLVFLAAGCQLGLNAVLITVCLLAFATVVFCWSFCTAQLESRLQIRTDRGCTIM